MPVQLTPPAEAGVPVRRVRASAAKRPARAVGSRLGAVPLPVSITLVGDQQGAAGIAIDSGTLDWKGAGVAAWSGEV